MKQGSMKKINNHTYLFCGMLDGEMFVVYNIIIKKGNITRKYYIFKDIIGHSFIVCSDYEKSTKPFIILFGEIL